MHWNLKCAAIYVAFYMCSFCENQYFTEIPYMGIHQNFKLVYPSLMTHKLSEILQFLDFSTLA